MRTSLLAALLAVPLVGCASTTGPKVAPEIPAPDPRVAPALDPRIDAVAREELDAAVARWAPTTAVAIVLEARTGAILAAQGRDGTRSDGAIATTRAFVTGSTLKPLTVAAALEENTVTPDTTVDCATRAYGTSELRAVVPRGGLSVADVVVVSSNVGMSRVYDGLGLARVYTWLHRFHVDEPPARVPDVFDEKSLDAARLAMGGLAATTPMQMAAAYAAIFNGGSFVAPSTTRGPVAPERVLSASTAAAVTSMLERAVASEIGTGALARVEGHRVAGKTGTADHEGQWYGSFVGTVLDAKIPFVVLVGFVTPRSSGYTGGTIAAPTFARIARRIVEE